MNNRKSAFKNYVKKSEKTSEKPIDINNDLESTSNMLALKVEENEESAASLLSKNNAVRKPLLAIISLINNLTFKYQTTDKYQPIKLFKDDKRLPLRSQYNSEPAKFLKDGKKSNNLVESTNGGKSIRQEKWLVDFQNSKPSTSGVSRLKRKAQMNEEEDFSSLSKTKKLRYEDTVVQPPNYGEDIKPKDCDKTSDDEIGQVFSSFYLWLEWAKQRNIKVKLQLSKFYI